MGREDILLRYAASEADRQQAYGIRIAVFVHEQGVPEEEELDRLDRDALHLLAAAGGDPVGTSRLVVTGDGRGIVGRVAVLPAWRRRGIAGRMLDELARKARQLGLRTLELHAQVYVVSLYAKHGYEVISDPYLEAGIEHVTMRRVL